MQHRLTGRLLFACLLGALLSGFTAVGLAFAVDSKSHSGPFVAGAYSFSDELGGFVITAARGSGTRLDPVVISQELQSSSPVTLMIRTVTPPPTTKRTSVLADGVLYLRLDVLNNSGQAWIEFEFELQEIFAIASEFGDGLSFDQRRSQTDAIASDRFARYDRNFEPYDRLLFKEGMVDPLKTASFSFLITDFTPRPTFYLVLDPRIPSS